MFSTRPGTRGGAVSSGSLGSGRKLVGLARTLATRPRLMLADEPAAGLDSAESPRLGGRLRALADRGLTILLIDHDMGMVLEVCDNVIVLDHGVWIATGSPEQIRSDPAVLGAYLGSADPDTAAFAGAEQL